MNIKNFRGYFNYTILERGRLYLRNKQLKKIVCDDNNNYCFTVSGTEDYTVTASISPEGELSGLSCDCPYDKGYCKHLGCALLFLDSIYDESISDRSSVYAGILIKRYSEKAAISAQSEGKVRLVPELTSNYEGLKFSLKIGREKLYVVNDIFDLYIDFQSRTHKTESKKKNPFCDHYSEAVCENLIKQYFLWDEEIFSIYIEDDDDVFRFNSDNTGVFLISLKAGGTGLNLTGADVVIHYDPWWNSSAENQASDCAYRIGQKNNVQIYKLITRRTIEEKIRELQLAKSGLADIVLNGGEGSIMNMTADEILELLG